MLSNLKLKNFRRFFDYQINTNSNFTIICGDNATGKTSILEAMYLLSTAKSPRTNDLTSLINDQSMFSIIEATYNENRYKVILSKNGKAAYVNDVEYKKISDFIAGILVVMFTPKDLNLIIGGRSERRKFFDLMISLCDKKYMTLLSEYKNVLKERNEILKQYTTANKLILDVVSDNLANLGEKITTRRQKFIDLLNNYIQIISKKLNFENIKVNYLPSIEKDYKLNLENKLNYDLLTKSTSVGPHRDDYGFEICDKEATEYASQGQMRSIVICLKLALKEVCELCNKKEVILLLDDVFAELDKNRQKELVLYLLEQKQTFITTTTLKEIPNEILQKANILKL